MADCYRMLIILLGLSSSLISTSGRRHKKRLEKKQQKSTQPPHIILIVIDDLGWNDVPWNNKKSFATNLGRYAREGIILDRHYVHSKCSPSRAALLTGRYAWTMGRQRGAIERFHPTGLSTDYKLLPERLKEAGYATHAVGKWHLGYCNEKYLPTRRGFDTFFGILNHMVHYRNRMIPCSTPQYRKEMIGYDLYRNESISHDYPQVFSPLMYAEEARNIISRHNPSQPLFLYLPFMAMHKPYVGPPPKSLLTKIPKWARKPLGRLNEVDEDEYEFDDNIDEENIREMVLAGVDYAVHKVIQDLKRFDMYKNSVILVTTDNGAGSHYNSPLRGTKETTYEGGTRGVAFLVSPLLPKTGFKYKGPIHLVDWFPTFLNIAGLKVTENIDGVDVWNAIIERKASPRIEIIHNIDEDKDRGLFQASIMLDQYKLIWGQEYLLKKSQPFARNRVQLFDVYRDPKERSNLANRHTYLVKELKKRILTAKKSSYKPADYPKGSKEGWPHNRDGIIGPGWC